MFTRRAILIFFTGCLILAGMIFFVFRLSDNEPSYQGRKLNEWLKIYDRTSDDIDEVKKAEAPIRAIGTNALPWLLTWLQYEPKPWQASFAAQLKRCPRLIGESEFLWSVAYREDKFMQVGRAGEAFRTLGPSAAAAIPKLVKMMNGTNYTDLSERAAYSLCWLGKDALPPLLNALTNPYSTASSSAAFVIGNMSYLGTNINPAIPVLIQSTQDKNRRVAVRAFRSLCRLQTEPELTIPTIIQIMADESGKQPPAMFLPRFDFGQAEKTLLDFGGIVRPYIPALIQLTTRTNGCAAQAAEVLGNLALEPETVIPALTNCLIAQDQRLQFIALQSLTKFGDAIQPVIPDIIPLTRSENFEVARLAIETLGQLAMDPEIVIPALTNRVPKLAPSAAQGMQYGNRGFYPCKKIQIAAINSLGNFGAKARCAIPLLKESLKSSHAEHDAAENALRKIAPEVLTNAPAQ